MIWYWVELESREWFLYQVMEQRGEHSTMQVNTTFFLCIGAPERAGSILTKVGLVVTTTLNEEPDPFPTYNSNLLRTKKNVLY